MKRSKSIDEDIADVKRSIEEHRAGFIIQSSVAEALIERIALLQGCVDSIVKSRQASCGHDAPCDALGCVIPPKPPSCGACGHVFHWDWRCGESNGNSDGCGCCWAIPATEKMISANNVSEDIDTVDNQRQPTTERTEA